MHFTDYFSPTASDPNGSGGSWADTALQPPTFMGLTTDPNQGSHTYILLAIATGQSGPVVVIDAIQIGEGDGSLPGNAAQILNVQVPAYTQATNNCSATTGQWNLQSTQIDLDTSHTSDTMWLNEVAVRFQP